MHSQPAVRTFDFPPQLDQAEIENRCARESFTWGPQALWLLCGLIWFFYLLVLDIPELARNTVLFGVGATVLACGMRRGSAEKRKGLPRIYADERGSGKPHHH